MPPPAAAGEESSVDIDAFVASRAPMWLRLEQLVKRARRPSRLAGGELDELVDLYQRVATDLSVVRTSSPDQGVVDRLSTLVAEARSVIAGAHNPSWRDVARFLTVTFPAAVYRLRWWWIAVALATLGIATAFAAWIVTNPEVHAAVIAQAEVDVQQLVERDFENYYSEHPAELVRLPRYGPTTSGSPALAISTGIVLGLPTLYVLYANAMNVGVVGGLMIAGGAGDVFFGLIIPHGLIELTAVFIAGGAGLKLGWTLIDPGQRSRADALAEEGRAVISVAMGLVVVLMVAGAIEAFVTPSPLPTWARIAIGVVAEVLFLFAMYRLGRRAVRAGETGDLERGLRGDSLPTAVATAGPRPSTPDRRPPPRAQRSPGVRPPPRRRAAGAAR
jgi:uncharacterized membrane protein SpoIIM required for sporulation